MSENEKTIEEAKAEASEFLTENRINECLGFTLEQRNETWGNNNETKKPLEAENRFLKFLGVAQDGFTANVEKMTFEEAENYEKKLEAKIARVKLIKMSKEKKQESE